MPRRAIHRPDELLVTLPFQLGYHPRRSVVLVGLRDREIALVQRFDLPPKEALPAPWRTWVRGRTAPQRRDVDPYFWFALDEVDREFFGAGQTAVSESEIGDTIVIDSIRDAVSMLVDVGIEVVAPVIFEDEMGEGDALAAFLGSLLINVGLEVLEPLWTRHSQWGMLTRPGEAHPVCPPSSVPIVADFVALGYAPAPSRAHLAELISPHVDDDRVALVGASVNARVARMGNGPVPRNATLAAWRRFLNDVCNGYSPVPAQDGHRNDASEDVGTAAGERHQSTIHKDTRSVDDIFTGTCSLGDLAAVVASLTNRPWRDGVAAWLCPETLPMEWLEPEVIAALRRLPRPVLPGTASSCTVGTVRWIEASLQRLCQLLPDSCGSATSAVLTLTAHVAWWRGDGAMARVCLDRALRITPGYRLAVLLDFVVDRGLRFSEVTALPAPANW